MIGCVVTLVYTFGRCYVYICVCVIGLRDLIAHLRVYVCDVVTHVTARLLPICYVAVACTFYVYVDSLRCCLHTHVVGAFGAVTRLLHFVVR